MTDHEAQPPLTELGEWREHRYYMVGKLLRQDLGGSERGYRETLQCACHDEPVKVIGPARNEDARYKAYCPITSEPVARADTMEELWSVAERGRTEAKIVIQQSLDL